MTLDDLLYDINLLEEEMRNFERKYGIRTETFYEAYDNGEEPAHDGWVQNWTAWASAYQKWRRLGTPYAEISV
jgi:hypothetical protein